MKAATPTLTAMTNLVDTREVRASECFSQSLLRVHQCLGGVSSEAELRAALAGPVAQLVPHRRFFGALLKRRPDAQVVVSPGTRVVVGQVIGPAVGSLTSAAVRVVVPEF